MKYHKIKYTNNDFKIVKAKNSLEVIKKYDLSTKENIKTKVIELVDKQLIINKENKNMKTYKVGFAPMGSMDFDIEAETEQEACELATEMYLESIGDIDTVEEMQEIDDMLKLEKKFPEEAKEMKKEAMED